LPNAKETIHLGKKNIMHFRLSICLLLISTFVIICTTPLLSHPVDEEDDGLTFFCPTIGTGIDTIRQRCLPPIPKYLTNSVADGDEAWFEALDAVSDITGSCSPTGIVIRVNDQRSIPLPASNDCSPQNCNQDLIVNRIIQIYDGNPDDPSITPRECTLTYRVMVPFNLRRCAYPQEFEVKCDGDVAGEYQNWLNAYAYTDFDPGCTTVMDDVTNPAYRPAPTVIDYLPGPENPNGCGSPPNPGNGFLRVQFWLVDECGFTMETVGNFRVVDDVAPVFDVCPDAYTIDISDADLTTSITDHLATAMATDNCSVAMITNSFDASQVDLQACDEQNIVVTHSANDGCGNIATSCTTMVTVTNSGAITLDCPAMPLTLECGSSDNTLDFGNWIATVRGTDYAGNVISNISNDFSISQLSAIHCNSMYPVTFVAVDNCGRTEDCSQMLTIEDTTPPATAGCPGPLTVNAADPDIVNDVNAWMSTFTATDDCLTTILPMNDLDQSVLAPNCGSRDVPVLFTADDNCNPVDSSCVVLLSIIDNVAADFTDFPMDITIECSTTPDIVALNAWLSQAQAANNLNQTFTVQNDLMSTNPQLGICGSIIDVRVFFADQCGQEVERFARIIVVDTQDPMMTCPPDQTLNADISPDINVDITNWLGSSVISDNCGVQPQITNYSAQLFDGCDETITNTITFVVEDECGNSSPPCTADLTITAQKRPSISCPPNQILECGDSLNTDYLNAWLDMTVATSVLGDTLVHMNDYVPGSLELLQCGNMPMEVRFFLTDNCGFLVECFSTIEVQDNTPPNIMCPPTVTLNSAALDNDQAIANWLNTVDFDDNDCLGPAISNDFDSSTIDYCTQTQILDIIFTVNDQCGFMNSCVGRIMFNQALPQITCPDATVTFECGDPNNGLLISTWLETATAVDNAGAVEMTEYDFDPTVIDSSCNQNIPVVFTVTDTCGQVNACTSNLIITDTQPPVYLNGCPDPLSLLSGSPVDNKMSSFQDWIDGIFISDCNGYTLTHDFDPSSFTVDCDDITIDITFSLVDDCGWIANDCMSQIIITNNVDAQINSADNLGNTFAVNNDFSENNPALIQCSGTLTVEFAMVNICGGSETCNANINIQDTTDPTITCPQDATFTLGTPTFDADVAAWLSSSVGMDDCISSNNLTYGDDYQTITALPACQREVTPTITFNVFDGCGNDASCTAILTVTSTEVSVLNCPPNSLTIECAEPGNTQLINAWLDSATGIDSDGSTLLVTPFYDPALITNIDCSGTVDIMFSMMDNCGNNADCTASIIVEDTTPPTAQCPADLTVDSTDPDAVNLANAWIMANGATDNCSVAMASVQNGFSIPNVLCNSQEINEVEFYAEDVCMLRDTCTARLTINLDGPQINCPGNIDLQCGESTNDQQIVDWINSFSGTDNHGETLMVSHDFIAAQLSSDCDSSDPITFTIVDACGVDTTCTYNIVQKDTLAPVILNCPDAISIDVEATDLFIQINNWLASFSAEDACNASATIDTLNNYDLEIEQFDCGDTQDVTFYAEDACGNIDSSCVRNINVFNNLVVTIECPDALTVICNDPATEAVILEFLDGAVAMSLDDVEITTSLTLEDFDIECSGPLSETVVFTATDRCGNFDECTQTLDFIPAANLYVPNIFNPSSEGENRFFSIRSNVAIELIDHFSIYSRWGDLMYERNNFDPNQEEGWDGRDKFGNNVQGVYTYVIRYKDIFNNDFEELGTLTLIE